MALLPQGPFALVALLGIVVGTLLVLRKGVPKAYGLGLVMMGVFLLDLVAAMVGQGHVQSQLGFRASDFFRGEGWWTPLTSVFTHAQPGRGSFFSMHFVGNLLLLVTAGPALEERIGERRFLGLFFAAAFAALAAHVALAYLPTGITSPHALALGASGGLFGVLTAFAVRYPRERLPMLLLFFFFQMPAFAVLLLYLAFNLVYMLGTAMGTATGIAWWGHFAGFLLGLAYAYRLPKHVDPRFSDVPAGSDGLPDPEKLAPLATTPALRRILDNVRQFTPEARTKNDVQFVDAWLDRFFEKAACPACGRPFRRAGLRATCEGGETTVEFSR